MSETIVSGQTAAARFAKTLMYWPLEEEHAEESGALAWTLFLAWIALGIVASFENAVFGIGLAVVGVYGSALVRYALVNWKGTDPMRQ